MSNRDELIGNSRRNLVLKTAGIIRVLVGDKYYNLDFRSEKDKQEDANKEVENNFIVSESIKPYETGRIEFPGNNKIIFTLDGNIYYTKDNKYNQYNSSNVNETIVDIPFTITTSGDVIAKNNKLISNLNAQYLDGKKSSNFIEKSNIQTFNKIIFNELSSSDGSFYYKDGVFSFDLKNKFEYMSLDSDSLLNLSNINYSIKSNGYKLILPNPENGLKVNIYSIDDIIVDTGDDIIGLDSGIYNTLICVPVEETEYKWIIITDNYFIEK